MSAGKPWVMPNGDIMCADEKPDGAEFVIKWVAGVRVKVKLSSEDEGANEEGDEGETETETETETEREEKRRSSRRNWDERWDVWGSVIRRVREMLNASSACMRRRGYAAI